MINRTIYPEIYSKIKYVITVIVATLFNGKEYIYLFFGWSVIFAQHIIIIVLLFINSKLNISNLVIMIYLFVDLISLTTQKIFVSFSFQWDLWIIISRFILLIRIWIIVNLSRRDIVSSAFDKSWRMTYIMNLPHLMHSLAMLFID